MPGARAQLGRCLTAAVLLGLLLQPPCVAQTESPAAEPSAESALGEIMSAWQHRQARIKTLAVEWMESDNSPEDDTRPRAAPKLVTLRLGPAGALRVDSFIPTGSNNEAKPAREPELTQSAFNGQTQMHFTSALDPAHDRPQAQFWASNTSDDRQTRPLKAWLLWCRPFATLPARVADNARVTSTTELLDGRKCAILEVPEEKPVGSVGVYWLDLQREALVMKYVQRQQDKEIYELKLRYKEHPDAGWVPNEWITKFPDETLNTRGEMQWLKFNPELPADEFTLTFPAGTVIYDRDADQHYVLQPDGQRRVLTEAETKPGGLPPLQPQTPEIAAADAGNRRLYLLGFLAAVVLLLVGTAGYLLQEGKKQQTRKGPN